MNVAVFGPASNSERTYLHNVLTRVLSDVTTMDSAREALSLGGDALLGYPQFSEVDLKLESPFLSRNATVPKLLFKLAHVPVLACLFPKRLHKPTAIANYTPSKRASGRVFCGISDGRFIGEVVGSAHLGVAMASASVSYDPVRNMTEGNLEACRLDPLQVCNTKHILVRKEAGQQFSNYQSFLNTIFNQSESRENSREGSTISPLSDTQVEGVSLKVSNTGNFRSNDNNDKHQFGSAPFTTELSLILTEITKDIPTMLKKPQEDSHWTFASPGPAYHLSQLDDVTRSLHFYRNSSRVSVVTQKNTFITSRGVWDSASRNHRDVPLDRYLKIGRQILTTASPHPNVSVLFGVEPFCRFHFAKGATNRRLASNIVTGLRAEVATTAAMYLSPSLMLSASGSVHVSESIDRRRICNLIKQFPATAKQDSTHQTNGSYNHRVVLSNLTKSEIDENLGDSIRSKLRGFAEVMSPTSFSYVKNEIMNLESHSVQPHGYTYTPIHDGYGCASSSKLTLSPVTTGRHMGNGFLARTHLMGIWKSPLRTPISGPNSIYLLAGIEAAIPKDTPLGLIKDLSVYGARRVTHNFLEYAAYTGVHVRTPIPVTATVSLWSSRDLTIKQRFTFGFSLNT